MSFERRWYQVEARDATIQYMLDNPGKYPLIQLPCGTGKAFLLNDIMMEMLRYWPATQFMVVTHSSILVGQNCAELKQAWPDAPAGIYCAGLKRRDTLHPIIFGSIASVVKCPKAFGLRNILFVDECFSGDTEVLTEKGFVRFDQLEQEKVAQYNSTSKLVSFIAPLRKISKESDYGLLKVESAKLFDLMVTENHRMLVTNTKGEWEKLPAKSIRKSCKRKMVTAGFGVGDGSFLSPFEKLMIAYQADGSEHSRNKNGTAIASFSFSKQRKIDDFLDLMQEGAFPFREVSSTRTAPRKNENPCRTFMVYAPYYLSKDITFYFNLEKISWVKAQAIISYMNKWDGHTATDTCYVYTNTDKRAADFYQAVCCLAGFRSKMTLVEKDPSSGHSDIYRLFICLDGAEINTEAWEAKHIPYKGKVYCVEVPEGNIIVRRNGKVLIVGNCQGISPEAATMYQKLINELKEVNPYLIVVGLTATGWRTKEGRMTGAEGMFDDVSYDLTRPQDFERLIGEGYLAPLITKRTMTQLDTTGVRTTAGEFNGADLQKAVNIESITYSAIQEVLELGHNRKHWIFFGSGTLHVESISRMLDSFGVPSVFVHSHIPLSERKRRIDLYKAGAVRAIVGNKILSVGFNYKPSDLLADLQPTQSVGMHIQKYGRLQRVSRETGKENGLILDFGVNIPNNGPVDSPYIPTGRTGKRTGDAPLKVCEACNAYNHTIVRYCHACGFEFIFQTKLTSTSSDANAMIGTAPVIEVFPVDHVSYLRHEKDGQKPSVKVTYTCGKNRYTEYVCMEHGGFPTKRAQSWWMERHASAPPATTQAVLEMTRELRQPVAIRVHTNLKYPAILNPIWN